MQQPFHNLRIWTKSGESPKKVCGNSQPPWSLVSKKCIMKYGPQKQAFQHFQHRRLQHRSCELVKQLTSVLMTTWNLLITSCAICSTETNLLVQLGYNIGVASEAIHCPGQHCSCGLMPRNQHCHQVISQLLAAYLQPTGPFLSVIVLAI